MQIFWVGDLPGQNTQQRYDLNPLISRIESGFTLLTPNVRLARRIKSAWNDLQAEQGATAWEPLRIYPLESWLLARWRDSVRLGITADRLIMNEPEALFLWRLAIEQSQAATGDFSLLQDSAAAELANQARERLIRWRLDYLDGSHRQAFDLEADCASFLAWSAQFQALIDEKGMLTSGDCFTQLLQAADGLTATPLLLLEFDDMPPLLRACVDALGSPVEFVAAGDAVARCSAKRFTDRRMELAGAARWACEVSVGEPQARVGIVLSDMAADRTAMEYLLRREFDCLGDNYTSLPVNFSTGITLDRAPVVRDAMAVLRLGLRELDADTPAALVRSPFLQLPDRDAPATVRLLRQVSASGKSVIEVADIRYLASRETVEAPQGTRFGQYLLSMSTQRSLRDSHLPSRWLEPINTVLDTWGWPGEGPLDSLEYQQVRLWHDTQENLAAFDRITGPLSLVGVLDLLQRLLASAASQPQTADSLVQVLGPLEAAGLEFDHLWLCGLQASQWPAAPRPSPFIPGALQRQFHMPHSTAEREWAIAEGLMRQYQCGTGELVASYAVQLDGVEEMPSALIAHWDMADVEEPEQPGGDWQSAAQTLVVEILQDIQAPVPGAHELARLRGGSALLEDQAQCPFRAFARRRLGVEPLGETVQGVSAASRGSLLHRALHLLFEQITDSDALAATTGEGEVALVQTVIGQALDELPRTGLTAPPGGWRNLEALRLERLLRQWLAVERQREAFRVAATEQELTLQLEALELRLRVDRIDLMPDGSTLVLDYKAGICQIGDWLGDRPTKPQLPLYAIASGETSTALSFARLRVDECAFVGVGEQPVATGIRSDIGKLVRGGWEVDSWEGLVTFWRQRLQMIAQEFLAGQASVQPQKNACNWCGLEPLCRIDREEIA